MPAPAAPAPRRFHPVCGQPFPGAAGTFTPARPPPKAAKAVNPDVLAFYHSDGVIYDMAAPSPEHQLVIAGVVQQMKNFKVLIQLHRILILKLCV